MILSPERGLPLEATGVEGEAQPEQVSATEVQEAMETMPPKERGLILTKARQVLGDNVYGELAERLNEQGVLLSELRRGLSKKGERYDATGLSTKEKVAWWVRALSAAVGVVGGLGIIEALHASQVGAEELPPGQHLRPGDGKTEAGDDSLTYSQAEIDEKSEYFIPATELGTSYEEALYKVPAEFNFAPDQSGNSLKQALLKDVLSEYLANVKEIEEGKYEGTLKEQKEYVDSCRASLTLAEHLFSDLTSESEAEGKNEPTASDMEFWQTNLRSLTNRELDMPPANHRLLEEAVGLAHQRLPFMTAAMEIALRNQAVNAENPHGGSHLSPDEFTQELDRLIDRCQLSYDQLHGQGSKLTFNTMNTGPEPEGSLDPERATMDSPDHLKFSEMYSNSKKAEIQTYVAQIDFTLKHLDEAMEDYFSEHPDLDEARREAIAKKVEKQADGLERLIKAIEKTVPDPAKGKVPLFSLEAILEKIHESNYFKAYFSEGSDVYRLTTLAAPVSPTEAEKIVAGIAKIESLPKHEGNK